MKLTTEQIIENETNSLIDALGSGIELNDEFLDKYCSDSIANALYPVKPEDRAFIMEGNITDSVVPGTWFGPGKNKDWIFFDIAEIEIQLEKTLEETVEEPDDFVQNDTGELAYLSIGPGIYVFVDMMGMIEDLGIYGSNKEEAYREGIR